jgi:methionyl-tRNA formyltransferase
MSGLRVAFAGTPDFALPAFHALARSRHQLVGVLTQPDRPKGRGRQLAASPVKLAALERGVPVSQPVSLKTEADRADLAAWLPDVLVVVAYGLILPRAALDLPRLGCVNIHASLLPRWRGAAPIQRAILAGDSQTGVSIMKMDVGLDTGPVFLEQVVSIGPQETGGSLHDRLADVGGAAVVQVLDELAVDSVRSTPQSEDGVTYAAKIDKAEALIDWRLDAVEIERKVRAFNPWPIAETRLDGEQLRIYAASVIDGGPAGGERDSGGRPSGEGREGASGDLGGLASGKQSSADGDGGGRPNSGPDAGHRGGPFAGDHVLHMVEPGTITEVRGDSIVVACGRGSLALTELQRPGRKPVAARDLINTLDLAGRRLG